MTRVVRTYLRWSPLWEGPTKQWTIRFINNNRWRCDRLHEFDDLLQDAYLTFMKIRERYPRVIEPGHFMSLYQRALCNTMHDKARYSRKKREKHVDTSHDVSELYDERIGEVTNYGYLNALLAEAPDELRAALAIISQEPQALHNRRGYKRENLNMKLRRALGLDKCRLNEHRYYDITGALRKLLEET